MLRFYFNLFSILYCHAYLIFVYFCHLDQNSWIRENLFDAHGNYLYCYDCILHHLRIHSERLSRQRQIKVRQCQQPILSMTKKEAADQKLLPYVLYPTDDDFAGTSYTTWWDSLSDSDEVEVKYPYEQHGLKGKPSNKSKPAVKEAFLQFVDANSHPNGRHAGSYSPLFYFIPKFTRIDPPKTGEKDFSAKAHASIVWTFNEAQQELGQATCSAFAARQWLKDNRPKVSLHPHKSDYCDTCKGLKEEISRCNAILKRLTQAGSSTETDLRSIESQVETAEASLKAHKTEAAEGRDYYKTQALCASNWENIMKLASVENPNAETISELTEAQHTFTLVLSADYQQSKLIPHWGQSEQPGSTYYLQKLSFDIFGLVDHRDNLKDITIFDHTIGP